MSAGLWGPIPGVRVIGVTGAARHGKDELAKAIIRICPGAERFAFSDAVAAVSRVRFGMTERDASKLQDTGTRYRQVDPAVWLRCMYGAIQDRRPRVAVVTGVRYPNELDVIRGMGGVLVAVRRSAAPPLTDRDPEHEVESHIGDMIAAADRVFEFDEAAEASRREAIFDQAARGVLALAGHAPVAVDVYAVPV